MNKGSSIKILHIISGLRSGGAENILYSLCQHDKEYRHVIISLTDFQDSGMIHNKENVSVHKLNFSDRKTNLFELFKLYKHIRQIKPDIVQTWMIHADTIGGIVARLAGVKNIFWSVHYTNLVKGKSKKSTILLTKINAFLSNFIPKKIIYCAEKSREVQESLGFKKTKGMVVQNGYDVECFTQNTSLGSKFRNELDIHSEAFVIGHVGSYHPLKDQANLIEALTLLDQRGFNFYAVFAGVNLDNNNTSLVSLIKDKGLSNRVHLLGRRNDIPSIMNGIDLFILSSESEAFPNVLNEAMACGTPCVSTDVGDASLILGDAGWIVPSKDSESLYSSVIKAAQEKESNNRLWLQRSVACRQRIVQKFSLEKMVKKYKEVWINFKNHEV
jgi:glycosyltransferase involved in cell wall biosynthesis